MTHIARTRAPYSSAYRVNDFIITELIYCDLSHPPELGMTFPACLCNVECLSMCRAERSVGTPKPRSSDYRSYA